MDATATVPERRAQKGGRDDRPDDVRPADRGARHDRGARQRGRLAAADCGGKHGPGDGTRRATARAVRPAGAAGDGRDDPRLHAASETPDQPTTGPAGARGAHSFWTGTCRAGGVDCLPDEDYAASAATVGVATADWAAILLIEQNTLPEVAARAETAQK